VASALRTILRIGVVILAVVVAGFCALPVWFYFYTGDLPDIGQLKRCDPPVATEVVTQECGLERRLIAIPADQIGDNLRNAVFAAESQRQADYATRLARSMFCDPMRISTRHMNEVRTAIQLRRQFNQEQLLVIYLNREYFGDNIYGIIAAALHLFQKPPKELTISEAALLAGLLKAPKFYSPRRYPARALERRNQVIDAMVTSGRLPSADAECAKSMPLNTTLQVIPAN
jgi:membrane carboxypeptidase/penicillin-binding protein